MGPLRRPKIGDDEFDARAKLAVAPSEAKRFGRGGAAAALTISPAMRSVDGVDPEASGAPTESPMSCALARRDMVDRCWHASLTVC